MILERKFSFCGIICCLPSTYALRGHNGKKNKWISQRNEIRSRSDTYTNDFVNGKFPCNSVERRLVPTNALQRQRDPNGWISQSSEMRIRTDANTIDDCQRINYLLTEVNFAAKRNSMPDRWILMATVDWRRKLIVHVHRTKCTRQRNGETMKWISQTDEIRCRIDA